MTADEVVDDLKARGTPVARSTVYRFLAHLEENGDVRKYITAEGSPVCYQFIDKSIGCAEHYHLMCKECGDIVHFENKKLEKLLRDMRDAGDGQRLIIDGPPTVFYGTCGKCASP